MQLYKDKYGENEWNPDAFEYANAVYFLTAAIKKANTIDPVKVADVSGRYGIRDVFRNRPVRR